MEDKAFISYLDDNDEKIEGFFSIVESNEIFIKFKSGLNLITIPYSRILKIKEKLREVSE